MVLEKHANRFVWKATWAGSTAAVRYQFPFVCEKPLVPAGAWEYNNLRSEPFYVDELCIGYSLIHLHAMTSLTYNRFYAIRCSTHTITECIAYFSAPCFSSQSGDGREYRGRLSYTTDYITCQRWSQRYPHRHELMSQNTDRNRARGLGGRNYCRNPDGMRRRPWCFTTKSSVEWQYCDVTLCWSYIVLLEIFLLITM